MIPPLPVHRAPRRDPQRRSHPPFAPALRHPHGPATRSRLAPSGAFAQVARIAASLGCIVALALALSLSGRLTPRAGQEPPTADASESSPRTTVASPDAAALVSAPDLASPREPLGASSRRTGLVLSEILYHPAPQPDRRNLEFIELYNAGAVFEDLSGWQLTGDVEFTFPPGTLLEADAFVVVAASPADFLTLDPPPTRPPLGPYRGQLPDHRGTVRLLDELGALRLEVTYANTAPWPIAADGTGHSLVLSHPSYGEADPRAWSASPSRAGSPGRSDPPDPFPSPLLNLVLNELLAHPAAPDQPASLELFNRSSLPLDISDCILTDTPSLPRFRVPHPTVLPPRGHLALDPRQLGFPFTPAGGTFYLLDPAATRVLDALRFGPQEKGVASGRCPDGAPNLRRLESPTPGDANRPRRQESVVISEIMYHPISGNDDDEYLELHNPSRDPVDLSDWRFVDGIQFRFPLGTTLQAGEYLVIARNALRLRSRYPHLTPANTLGDFDGRLSNRGERLALAKPETWVVTNASGLPIPHTGFVVVTEVAYADGGRWGTWADGGGSSLELIDPAADPLQPSSWADSDETQKAPWTWIEVTGKLEFGNRAYTPTRLHVTLLGRGECLLDEVGIFPANSGDLLLNGGFETGTPPAADHWSFFGNHSTSTVQNEGASAGNRCLHLRAQGDGDTGPNSVRASLTDGLNPGDTATLRARVRWLAGWPQILLRTRGNWLELAADLQVPTHLGTPALPNSRRTPNAGPAIFSVQHHPPLPAAHQPVVVSCRLEDPDGLAFAHVSFRPDPGTAATLHPLHDDGLEGDALAGDGIASATLPGRPGGARAAFVIEAADQPAAPRAPATARFPATAPLNECLVRWGDPIPPGTFPHYHLWSTTATEAARRNALDNTERDATLVCGNHRILYNVGFRDKGSPYHGGAGDFVITVPRDDLLLGTDRRVFASAGNNGAEPTALRSHLCAWIARQLGLPYLHSHSIRFYRNGSSPATVMEDLEEPSHAYAQAWFPDRGEGDLYKVAVWFEYADDNRSFGSTSATLEEFKAADGTPKLARYRWNFQRRSSDGDANNYTNHFRLAAAANDRTRNYVPRLRTEANVEQWMRVFGYHRVLGNWDSWSFDVGQNMYTYWPPGSPAILFPWDFDFVLGLGNGPTDALWGGHDPILNRMYDTPAFRRMLWRLYQDAVDGPLRSNRYGPQIAARAAILAQNGITGLADPQAVSDYLEQRRTFITNQLATHDTATFTITSNDGVDFSTPQNLVTLRGTAPFAVQSIEVNGLPLPVTWDSFTAWTVTVPLLAPTNSLSFQGRDHHGQLVSAATDHITLLYTGPLTDPAPSLAINEILYQPVHPGTAFVEIFNASAHLTFDLSQWRLEGTGFTFPPGTLLAPNQYLVVTKDRAAFTAAYGSHLPIAGEFPGELDPTGETLRLVAPGVSPNADQVIDEVRYDHDPPWPSIVSGQGVSLQLIDPQQDHRRVANWAVTPAPQLPLATPGAPNSVRATLAPFPTIWLNEIQPQNTRGHPDHHGEQDPWIELHNPGPHPLDLADLSLTADLHLPTRWSFPPHTVLPSGGFLVIWADAQPDQSTPDELHTNFRLAPSTGTVALTRLQNDTPVVLDYLPYSSLRPDLSYGSYPDGHPHHRRPFHFPTPGSPNHPAVTPVSVFLNEWMAANTHTLEDPADGDFEDWFELHNAGTEPADLGEYYLTDDLTQPTKFSIPPGTQIPPGGFLLVWADEETAQNGLTPDLHTNFRLNLEGETLSLFAPDFSPVDSVTYGPQDDDASEGRWPDGAPLPSVRFEFPTPRAPNVAHPSNHAPTLALLGDQTIPEHQTLTFTAHATDPDHPHQNLTFTLVNAPPGATLDPVTGTFTWTPTEAQGPASHRVLVRVDDDGSPPRFDAEFIRLDVREVNSPPSLAFIPDQVLARHQTLTFTAQATDSDLPAHRLTFLLQRGAPEGATLDRRTGLFTWTPNENHRLGHYTLTVRALDDGSPSLSSAQSFQVTVVDTSPGERPVMLQLEVDPAGSVTLEWTSLPGRSYRVEFAASLLNAEWQSRGDISATASVSRFTDAAGPSSAHAFYRILLLP